VLGCYLGLCDDLFQAFALTCSRSLAHTRRACARMYVHESIARAFALTISSDRFAHGSLVAMSVIRMNAV
ncbi:MAG: hypothetical protein ACRDAM_12710, partial [Casimicrobium sp.]